jgi:hypothetical protein
MLLRPPPRLPPPTNSTTITTITCTSIRDREAGAEEWVLLQTEGTE